jgi:hypothetical protein
MLWDAALLNAQVDENAAVNATSGHGGHGSNGARYAMAGKCMGAPRPADDTALPTYFILRAKASVRSIYATRVTQNLATRIHADGAAALRQGLKLASTSTKLLLQPL